jgi:membrane protease YdiL (CAAX protease family)
MSLFFDPASELRSGFRAILFFVFAFLVLVISQTLVKWVGWGDGTLYQAVLYPLEAIGTLGVSALAFRGLEHRSLAALGFRKMKSAVLFLGGAFGGILAISVVFIVVCLQMRGIGFLSAQPSVLLHREFLIWLNVFFFAASVEEMIFRGYPFLALRKSLGRWGASALLSVLFAAGHPSFYHSTAALLSTLLGGIFLTQLFVLAESLWLPIGFHFGWNLAQSLIYPLPGRTGTLVSLTNFDPAALGLTKGAEQSPWAGVVLLGLTILAEILVRKKDSMGAGRMKEQSKNAGR